MTESAGIIIRIANAEFDEREAFERHFIEDRARATAVRRRHRTASKAAARDNRQPPELDAAEAAAAEPPSRQRSVYHNRGPTHECITDLQQTVFSLSAYVYMYIDCVNRRTTAVRRFCLANGLPVLRRSLSRGDVYVDAAVVDALRRAGISCYSLCLDISSGAVSPALLTDAQRATAAAAIAAHAALLHFDIVAAPPFQTFREGETRLDKDNAAVAHLGAIHSNYIEQTISLLRGAGYASFSTGGKIPSHELPSRFSIVQHSMLMGGRYVGAGSRVTACDPDDSESESDTDQPHVMDAIYQRAAARGGALVVNTGPDADGAGMRTGPSHAASDITRTVSAAGAPRPGIAANLLASLSPVVAAASQHPSAPGGGSAAAGASARRPATTGGQLHF
jgi:hypothetical protein